MRLLNWNTEWVGPRSHGGRFQKARKLISGYDADVICLTEARAETMPNDGHSISSELSGAGNIENRGARKVVLWCRGGWTNVDTLGSARLPKGRFASATTTINGLDWNVVGMCIPYHGYRNHKKLGDGRKRNWQGACEFLDALREEILPQPRFQNRTILLGDFNLQIPPKNYPYRNSPVNRKREATFAGWSIPTAGEWDDPALDKRFIDHVALTPDTRVESMRFVCRFSAESTRLSDHNGVFIEIVPA